MLPNNSARFITNQVKGMQSLKKRLKLMQYVKDKIGSNGILFLRETHFDGKVKQKWRKEFKGSIFFFSRNVKFLWRLDCLLCKKECLPLKNNKQIRKVVF